jgi:uncharacterized LabA/DUF88 family protein
MSNGSAKFENSAVLIDFENFYLGREAQYTAQNPGAPYHDDQLASDLRLLLRYCNEVSGSGVRVCRAYSDFTARRESSPARIEDGQFVPARYDYYLTRTPRILIELGIEPIQVFRFSNPGSGSKSSKNAVDIRMAMDSSALCRQKPAYDLLVLVSGDSDFIPVVVDCRRQGMNVYGIGVVGATNRNLEEFCDRFVYFSELEAYFSHEDSHNSEIARVTDALRKVLRHRDRLPAAAVRPELNKVLSQPFNPEALGCRTMGEFFREFRAHLEAAGFLIERAHDGWYISLDHQSSEAIALPQGMATEAAGPAPVFPEASAAPLQPRSDADDAVDEEEADEAANGAPVPLRARRPAVPEAAVRRASSMGPRGMLGTNYRQILQIPPVRYYVYPRPVFLGAAQLVLRAVLQADQPPTYDELVAAAKDLGHEADIPPLAVSACAFGICASRALVPIDTFQTYRRVDKFFHWKPAADLPVEDLKAAAEKCFERFVFHLAQELRQRLAQRQGLVREALEPERLASLWADDDPTPADIELADRAIKEALATSSGSPAGAPALRRGA